MKMNDMRKQLSFRFMDFMYEKMKYENININESESLYDLHVMIEDMSENVMTLSESHIEWFIKFILLELVQNDYKRILFFPEKNIEKFTNEILMKLFRIEIIESVINKKMGGNEYGKKEIKTKNKFNEIGGS